MDANLEQQATERDVGGVTYKVVPLPWRVGKKALMRLVKALSPLLAGAFSGGASAALAALPSSLSDDDLDYFAQVFGDSCWYKREGQWVPLVEQNQASHFAGRYLEHLRWLGLCVEVNYAGFFAGLMSGNGASDLLSKMANPSKSTPGIG